MGDPKVVTRRSSAAAGYGRAASLVNKDRQIYGILKRSMYAEAVALLESGAVTPTLAEL